MSRGMVGVLAAVAVGVLALAARAEAPKAGEVVAAGGVCVAQSGGARLPLKAGDAVHVGDNVACPAGAKVKLRMADGSVIAVAPQTSFAITAYAAAHGRRSVKLSLFNGLLRAVVAATGRPSRFEVDTATGVAAVRSTDWFIEAKPDTTQVGVLAGVVRLTSTATGGAVDIPARWGARVAAGKDPVQPRLWRRDEFDEVIARTTPP